MQNRTPIGEEEDQAVQADGSTTTVKLDEGIEGSTEGEAEEDLDVSDVSQIDDLEKEEEQKKSYQKPPLFGIKPEDAASGIDSFLDLPMHKKVHEAVQKIGWTAPTPVQKLCLPYTLRGRHVAGFAQTGTGKTAVFLLTICNQILNRKERPLANEVPPLEEAAFAKVQAVVLAPTRELALQIEQDAEVMLKEAGLVSICVIGGIDYDKQVKKLKEGVDIIFATPGRLKDYVQKKHVDLSDVQVFVCDEADRMFDMGFIEDVEFFLEKIPEESQKLLFSATTNDQVKELAFEYLETPEYISVNPEELTPEKIEQKAFHCHATQKLRVMLGMLREHQPDCSIIFTNTKLTAEWLHFKLEKNGIEADLITGDLPQKKRIRLIQRIKDGKLKALIATDVASRGLHISRITHVYNFDLPEDPANYIHRIGRTARAGAKGNAYSLVCDDYGHNLNDINALFRGRFELVSVWPPDSYLEIKDVAGNPFADRYKNRDEQRASHRDYKPKDFRQPFRESDRQREGQRGFDQAKHKRGDRQKTGGAHDRRYGKTKGGQFSNEKYDNRAKHDQGGRHSDRKAPVTQSTELHESSKFSFMDLVRRLLKVLFGWKSKK